MSSAILRTAIDTVVTSGTPLSFPVYDTVNKHQDPTEDTWYTYAFNVEAHVRNSFCGDWREEGSIEFYCITQAGTGSALIALVESDMKTLANQIETHANNNNINLTINEIHPIVDLGGDSGAWTFHVQLDYTLIN
jgi:hypothetical protein